jgi:hypothetical protein
MHFFANASVHDWSSFVLGALAGIVCILVVKHYSKRKDN